MQVGETSLPGVLVLTPARHADHRGVFTELYSRAALAAAGIAAEFVQDNMSISTAAGTVRGLHFQRPPCAQAKLVYVLRGSILDVVVDLRHGVASYGRHLAVTLSAAAGNQVFVPVGFAHGLCTLEPDTQVIYKVSSPYAPSHDGGLLWNDPALGIDWPVQPGAAVVSEKDRRLPRLAELPACFTDPAGSR
jgi:dTDP-4-dehydrorhamnose 3,5-epimerase